MKIFVLLVILMKDGEVLYHDSLTKPFFTGEECREHFEQVRELYAPVAYQLGGATIVRRCAQFDVDDLWPRDARGI